MDRLSVCLVSAAYRPYPSGVGEHVHNLATGLHQLGQAVHVLTTRFPRRFPVTDAGPPPFPVTRLGRAVLVPLNRSFATVPVGFGLSRQVRRFLAAHRFDVVHCHGLFWPELSWWAIRHSTSLTVTTGLTAGFVLRRSGSGLFRRIFGLTLAKVKGRIAISSRAAAALDPWLPGGCRVIPSGVDLGRFRPGILPLTEHRPGRPAILFLGRLDERKGLDVLLRAMPDVLDSLPGTRLLIVGQGPGEMASRRLVDRLGIGSAVEFCGRVPLQEIPRAYASADVYCSPALGGETLGVVLLEAMACGTPVVASDIPGYDETVRSGTDGLLCPPGDPRALAQTLLQVLRNPDLSRRLAAAGPERARDYSWPLIASRTLDYYRELRDAGRPGASA